MTEPVSQISGASALRPRARLLRTFGDELISSETVAIIELVKNAYDADATRVLVSFHEPLEVNKGKIEVIDNGNGMSLQTIQTAWMEPATLFKKQEPRSQQLKRRVLGEKGIGRFAASRLANFLEVVTRDVGNNHELRVFFDWSAFDDEQKYLDQIESLWEEIEPVEIKPSGTIEALWRESEQPQPGDLTHGTILRMEGLRSVWTEKEFMDLRRGLARLVSPFFGEDRIPQNDTFQIYLSLPGTYKGMSGVVKPPEALENPHYLLKGCVDKTGKYDDLVISMQKREGQEHLKGEFHPKGHVPQCGPFCIELRVWDRDSLQGMAQKYGSTIQSVRRDLDDAAGVNIYRDGFRVFPYGERGNDWLGLDSRRVQNPTLRLSNNQVVGYVSISADTNPQLRDQSNREGIIAGPALDDFRELIKMMMALLEERRYAIRRQPAPKQSRETTQGLFTNFNLADVQNLVMQQHPEDAALIALVGEKEKYLERRLGEVQEVLSRYRNLATLGQLIDTVIHDGRTPLSKIKNEAQLGQRDMRKKREITSANDAIFQRLVQRFEFIIAQSDVLATIFRKIEPFGGRKRGQPKQAILEQAISNAFSVLSTEINEIGVRVSLPETETQAIVDQAEIQQVIINLLQNSLYWLRQVPQDDRQIIVQVRQKNPDEAEIIFSDSGKGVEPEFREYIFEPYFSTKPDGVGLGLAIAGEIINEYYAGKLELLESDPLPGATFRITLHNRR
jgi:signal transduction histidine kinase